MKRVFGSWLTRLLRGGHRLTEGEYFVLCQLVEHLDPRIRATAEAQFDLYNLVQRESDARALNFYRIVRGTVHGLPGSPLLSMDREKVTPVRISLEIPGQSEVLHATLTAVRGVVSCASFSHPVPADFVTSEVVLRRVVRSPPGKSSNDPESREQS